MHNNPNWKNKYREFLDARGWLKPSAPLHIKEEVVLREFKDIHDNRYDYSSFRYTNAKTKSEIICKEHGKFSLTPNHHKRGVGCGKCANFGFDQEKHIDDFRKIHGAKYDYSDVEYICTSTPIKIRCREHGIFLQAPDPHKRGRGCPKCSGKGVSVQERIEIFNHAHKNKYDYSLVKSIPSEDKMLIICPEHGLFSQLPGNHLRHGCGKCAAAVSARKKTINADEILSHFVRIHGDQYDYTRVNYVKNSIKVEILCPIHGSFHVTPQHHKRGVGCNKCTGRGLSDKERIEYWETIHGLKYDYSLVEYEGDASPVKIICEEHGIFEQLPTHHRQGVGCPSCAGREFNVLYIWTDKHGNHKIGVTKSIKGERRIYDCAKKRETTAFNIRLIRVENAIKHEQLIHKTFTKIPYTKGDGWTEFRKLSDEEYSEIQEYFNAIEGTSEF